MIDHRSYAHNLNDCEIKAWKNIWSFICSLEIFTIYGYITISQRDQLPDGLIAQLVEHCTGIAEVMGSNPV